MNFRMRYWLMVASISLLYSCRDEAVIIPPKEKFLHVSHTYVPFIVEQKVDSLVQRIPFSDYKLVLLGGDLSNRTSELMSTLYYVDSIFDLDSPTTLWSIGNHDYDNVANVLSVTHKPLYYSYYHKGITFLILDTQDSLCNFKGEQLQLIKNVTDTISESSHLILLHHLLVWMYGNSVLEPQADSVANGPLGNCFWCIAPNNFYQDVYPALLNVKSRGIDVICVGGDLGYKTQEFRYETPEGILYLAGGLCSGCAVNKCIVFDYYPESRELTYNFRLLEDLVE